VAVLVEAVGLAVLHWILGLAVRAQEMSLAGLSTDTMSLSTWTAGALLGGFLLLCGLVLVRAAVRDRLSGRPSRLLVVGCLVTQAVLATLAVGLAGWGAFIAMMTVFGLLLWTLTSYEPRRGTPGAPGPAPAGAPQAPLPGRPDAALA
jgi:hypothetical protein